jgi:hypothetical protein
MTDKSSEVSRRHFIQGSATVLGSLTLLQSPLVRVLAAGTPARKLPAGPQLFLDDNLIAEQKNLRRVIQSPDRLPEPIVTSAQDKCFQPYVSVLRDPVTRRFRLWYNTAVDSTTSHIGYMESQDGMHFLRPHRELADPSGLPVAFGAYVVDDGPDFPDPAKRYKLGWERGGLFTAFSPDGLTWTASQLRQVLGDIGDIVALSRDPIRNRYLLTCKVASRPEDGYKGSTPNAAEGTRRLVGQSFSDDCIHWSPAERIIVADDQDEGVTEFYSIGNVIARGGMLVGLLKVLRDDLAPEPGGDVTGIGYTCLAWTHDGKKWHRDRQPFMDRNSAPGTWDRAMTWGDCLLPVNDEVFIYYGGYARGHKVERFKERQLGFARIKRDRFVAREASEDEGSLRTVPFVLAAEELSINANIGGDLRVAILDEAGSAIEGFGAEDCARLQGDSLTHTPRWKHPLAALNGKTVKLQFTAKDAQSYAFELV